jgi:N-acetylmuramoyl-L-alanine amidase
VFALAPTPPLVCLDPGHGTVPAVGRQTEPIGPGSSVRKIKDGGGAPGEAPVALAIARRTQALLKQDGYRVAMTRTGPTYAAGNIARARFCNVRHAALMIRIHADGSTDSSQHGVKTLVPALHRGWTDDIYRQSLRAGRSVQAALVHSTAATNAGVLFRSDLTGFNWADVPAILVETGFMTNPTEGRLLRSAAYQLKIARGLAAGTRAFAPITPPRTPQAAAAACDLSRFTLAVTSWIPGGSGDSTFVLRLRNAGSACALYGYPRVIVRDRRGAIPFSITHRGSGGIKPRPPQRFVVAHDEGAFVVLGQYRCDLDTLRKATVVQLRRGASSVTTTVRDYYRQPHYCGVGDPGSVLAVSPFVQRISRALRP